jgi:hypothetical protein
MFAWMLLLVAAPSAVPLDAFERITPEEAAKRLEQCGLGRVTTRYEALLDEDVLIATAVKSPSDEQLACADKAVSFYTLKLPPNVQPHYEAMREARLTGLFEAQARAWLSARGLLSKVPKYQKGVTDDAAFTRQIETLCGPGATSAFQSKFGFHALSPDWGKREFYFPDRSGVEVLTCLMHVTTVAGFEFGFIGNEYYRR